MLNLSRKRGQSIVINGDVIVKFVGLRSGQARIIVIAPDHVQILREELLSNEEWEEVANRATGGRDRLERFE